MAIEDSLGDKPLWDKFWGWLAIIRRSLFVVYPVFCLYLLDMYYTIINVMCQVNFSWTRI